MDRPSTAGRSRTTPLTTRARARPKSAHLTSKNSTSGPKKQPHIGFTGYTDYTRNNDTNGNTKSNSDGVDSTSIAGTIRFNFNDRPRPATTSGPDASSRPTTSTGTTATTITTTNNTSTRGVNGKGSGNGSGNGNGNGNGNTRGSAQASPPSRQRSQGRPDAIQKGHTFVTSNFPTLVDQSNKGGGGGGDERVPQTENKSVHLLRGLVSAETGLHKKSTMELLITAFLRYSTYSIIRVHYVLSISNYFLCYKDKE
jgi:hypothetical protein